ncbi:hypothetical protein JMJ35_005489 [Cladonia borealis]|uniref:Uncharacterized protein n=1 Tax=Cladonia borealis TaxID=184061 RepID=A0AA39R2R0_9LECA|nr:hypothetical protein JMJ35_005489 [Cladonia borealis]
MKFTAGMVAMGLAMAVEASPPRPAFKGYEWMPAKRAYTGTGTAPMPMLTGTAPIAPVKVIATGYPVTATMYRPCPTCPAQKIGNNTVVTATAPCPTCPVPTAGGNNSTVIMTKACPTCPLVPVTPTAAPSSQITPNSPFRPGMAFNFANSTANFVQPPATGISGVVGPPAITVIASTATNGVVTFATVTAAVGSPQSQIEFPVTETAANGQVTVATETAIPANGQNAVSTESGSTTQNPSTNETGATTQNPSTNEAGATTQNPSTNEAGATTQNPSTNEAGSTSESPATNEAGAAPQSPSTNGAGSESQNPSSTEAGTTSPNAESPAESPEAFVGAASSSFRVPITLSAISLALMLVL